MDGHYTLRFGQKALQVGGTAVDMYLSDVQAGHVEHRVPGGSLDLETPRAPRIELDLSPPDASQPSDDHGLASDDRRRGGGLLVRNPNQVRHVGAAAA